MSEKADSRVTLCPDGKYRWVYEVPMLKNPSILYDVYKVLGISFGVVWLLNVLLIGCEDGFSLKNLWAGGDCSHSLCDRRMVLWLEICGAFHDGREGNRSSADAPPGEESADIRCIDILCRSRSRQTKCRRYGLSGSFSLHNHLRARQRRPSHPLSSLSPD